MYHTVKIDSIDQHTHRFLWRNIEIEREPDVYVYVYDFSKTIHVCNELQMS